MTYHAEIIAVGTELLLGNIANTDAQELSQALASVGVDVLYHTVVGDNPQRLEEAIAIARKRADLLIFTGGLGPTYDDLTKETVCRVLDVPLTFHPEAAADIRRNFDTIFHREMPPGTLRQAELPEGCEVFCNRAGTAPGCVFRTGDVTAVLLPGVPSECRYLTETALLPCDIRKPVSARYPWKCCPISIKTRLTLCPTLMRQRRSRPYFRPDSRTFL